MANLRDIKKRITGVESTRQITRTMEMVATARIRRATDRIVAAAPYAMAMVEVLETVAERAPSTTNPLLEVRPNIERVAVIVVVSDRGLAGGFNSNVLRAADRFIAANRANGVECDVIACGKKAIGYFRYRKQPMVMTFSDHSADPQIAQAREISTYVIDAYVSKKIDRVVVFYNHTKNVAEQILRSEVILPVEKVEFHDVVESDLDVSQMDEAAKAVQHHATEALAEARRAGAEVSQAHNIQGDFEYEPSASAVLDTLLPSYVETRVFHALLDSAAGEQGARRRAMKAATDNATEMITTLTRIYNRARQGAITTEIIEIVGGAAALEDE